MENKNDIQEKVLDRIRKLIRLKESTTSEGEANNAAMQVNRLLKEYNLSLLDIDDRQPEKKFRVRESDRLSFKDAFGNYWKRDLLRTLCRYNYCRMLRYTGTTDVTIVGTDENIAAVTMLYDYLRITFRRLAETRHRECVSSRRGYYRTEKYRKRYIRSYLEGVTPGLREQYEKIRNLSAGQPDEKALIRCHDALISRYLESVGAGESRIRKSDVKIDFLAYHAGILDGRNVSLNRQIKGGSL